MSAGFETRRFYIYTLRQYVKNFHLNKTQN